jgi:hypothetical protein
VLGVFYTPGWAAVLTVGGTLGGVIVTRVANSWSTRVSRLVYGAFGGRGPGRPMAFGYGEPCFRGEPGNRALGDDDRGGDTDRNSYSHLTRAGPFITEQLTPSAGP